MNTSPRRVIIVGAAGRDFHNFNVRYRGNAHYQVVAFTAAQIPGIDARIYPAQLAGAAYPDGIPIYPESELARLIRDFAVDRVVFAYSDVTHEHVMHLACIALANGASYELLGPRDTMLDARCPVVAVLASRTGAGKSTLTRYLCKALRQAGLRPVVVRHPMPYGRFDRGVERYASITDLVEAALTIEEMEEYEPHVERGAIVYAGVDYAEVLEHALQECDVILWDGGNNDMSFFRPQVTITALDPLRPGEEAAYFPGEVNVRTADIMVIAKANVARSHALLDTARAARQLNPEAAVVRMAFEEAVDRPSLIAGKRVLAIEDGPSVTHGGLVEAAAARAVRMHGGTLIDPREYAVGSLQQAYRQFPRLGAVLPALGYNEEQRRDLQLTIGNTPGAAVVLGTPVDLARIVKIRQPVVRVSVCARDLGVPTLADLVLARLRTACGIGNSAIRELRG